VSVTNLVQLWQPWCPNSTNITKDELQEYLWYVQYVCCSTSTHSFLFYFWSFLLIFLISSSFSLLSKSSHMIYSNLKLQPKTKICITVITSAYSHFQMTSMYTGFLDLDMMIMKKTFKGQESLSSQPCLVGITLENILLKMLIHKITYLETFTLVYNHIFTKTYKWQTTPLGSQWSSEAQIQYALDKFLYQILLLSNKH